MGQIIEALAQQTLARLFKRICCGRIHFSVWRGGKGRRVGRGGNQPTTGSANQAKPESGQTYLLFPKNVA